MPARAFRARRARNAALVLPACALAALAAAAGPREPLYRWSDDAGNVRYTTERERIPSERRAGAVRVELPSAPAPDLRAESAPPDPSSPDAGAAGAADAPEAGDALAPVEAPRAASEGEAPAPPSPLDQRIAELERAIAADQAVLTEHISDPERAARLHDSEEIAAIAERLPRLQEELRALRAQRDGAGASDGP